MTFEDSPISSTAEPAIGRDVVLTFLGGPSAGQTVELWSRTRVVLGRSADCDVEVLDGRVSRQHCAITLDGEEARLEDLGSANGTFVNGQRARLTRLAS